MRFLRQILWVLALVVTQASLYAQFDTAEVIGVIRDTTGGALRGSKVTLLGVATGVSVVAETDENGNFHFFNVRPGRYTLKSEAQGFRAAASDEFSVTVGARQRVELTMQVGDTKDSVIVQDAVQQLETDSSARGQVIAGQAVVNLPLNGRSYADLALLSPGVRKSVLENQTTSNRDASYNINGQRSALNNFLIDGVDNNAYGTSNQGFSNQVIQPSPDAVSEFRVETNNYSAEYGRAAGGVINVTTKTGSNAFHGAAWEYMRNTALNAVGFFKPTNNFKPVFIQNQFGAALGGPIKKDKLFFFGDYEGLRRVTKALTFATVPTLNDRAARFSTSIRNPLTGAVYADGVLPASAISPFARAVVDALPLPTTSGTSNNYDSLPRAQVYDNKGNARVDYYSGAKMTAFFRYSQREMNIFDPPNIPGPAGGNANGNVRVANKQFEPALTYTLSPSSVIEGRLGVTWTEGGKTPIGAGQTGILQANGITGLPTDAAVIRPLNTQNVTGYSQFGGQPSNPQFQNPFVINPKLNYSKVLGRHSLKFGYEYQRIDTAIDDFNPVYGQDDYASRFSGNALADFYMGLRSGYQLNNFVIVDYRQRMHFFYAKDDYKISNKLTVNVGLRYEYATPQWEKDNHLANFDPATNTLLQAKDGSLYDRALVNPQHNNWAPRLGIAYQLNQKTVLRSAYGISWIQFNRLGGENLLSYNGPYIVNAQITQDPNNLKACAPNDPPTTCFRTTQQGYPANFAIPSNFNPLASQARYIPKDNPTGYVQSWHFTIQRELAKDWVLDVGYVGNKGTHLMDLADWNQARPNAVGQNLSLQSRRPITNFAAIEVAYGVGFSSYHALQTKLEKRFSKGLLFINAFTWSKAIDNASGHLETANGDNSRVNLANVAADKGVSSYDQTLNNTTSLVYELPFGKNQRFGGGMPRVVDAFLGGWKMTGINTATSGLPVNLTYSPSSAFSVSGLPTYRPNVFGPVVADNPTPLVYFNKANVAIPTDVSRPFGTAGRNTVRGPGLLQLDLGLHKQFQLWSEASRLEFRAESFNLTNRTNFQAPDGNFSNSTFGRISSTYPARQFQFALRLMF